MDVAFEMVDGNQWKVSAEGEGLGEADADEERASETGAFGDRYGGEIGVNEACAVSQLRALHRLANDWHDGAEVLARG